MKFNYNDCIGKTIRRIDHDAVNWVKILFEDGTTLEFEGSILSLGGAGTIGTIVRVNPCIPENPGQDPYDYE
jgi:hypothetical protein